MTRALCFLQKNWSCRTYMTPAHRDRLLPAGTCAADKHRVRVGKHQLCNVFFKCPQDANNGRQKISRKQETGQHNQSVSASCTEITLLRSASTTVASFPLLEQNPITIRTVFGVDPRKLARMFGLISTSWSSPPFGGYGYPPTCARCGPRASRCGVWWRTFPAILYGFLESEI